MKNEKIEEDEGLGFYIFTFIIIALALIGIYAVINYFFVNQEVTGSTYMKADSHVNCRYNFGQGMKLEEVCTVYQFNSDGNIINFEDFKKIEEGELQEDSKF